MRATPLVLVATAVLVALAGCSPVPGTPSASSTSSPSAETPTPTPSTPPEPCGDQTLSVTVAPADSSAGHLHYKVGFTNDDVECTLSGFPQVAVIGNGNGTQFGVIAEQVAGSEEPVITLTPGDTAYALLTAVNIDPGGGPLGPDCAVGNGDGYNVWVPGSIEPVFVPAPGVAACTSGLPWMTIGAIGVS